MKRSNFFLSFSYSTRSAFALIGVCLCFGSCRQQIVEPPATPIAIQDYFWNSASLPQQFTDTLPLLKPTDLMTFSGSGSSFTAMDNTSTRLACQVFADSILASGFDSNSIIALDNNYSFFSAVDTEERIACKITAASITTADSYAATDHGIWHTSSTGWVQDDTTAPAISFFAFDYSSNILYAATQSGQILQKNVTNTGAKWSSVTSMQKPLNAFVCYNGVLYAAPTGGIGVYQLNTGSVTPQWSPIPSISEEVTALFCYTDHAAILIGTISGNSYFLLTSGGSGIPSGPVTLSSAGHINCFQSFNKGLIAGTDNGIYASSSLTSGYWTAINPTKSITALSVRHNASNPTVNDTICFISKSALNWIAMNAPTVQTRASIPAYARQFVSTSFGVTNNSVVTDYLIYSSKNIAGGGSSWLPPLFDSIIIQYSYAQGNLTLLRSDCTSDDKTWRAGTLAVPGNVWQSFAITGRFEHHLDALQIDGKSYQDVLMVRYSHELPSGDPQSDVIPYWEIYYQKGRGPIMFDKFEKGQLSRRQILK